MTIPAYVFPKSINKIVFGTFSLTVFVIYILREQTKNLSFVFCFHHKHANKK